MKYFIGNWKMNMNSQVELQKFSKEFSSLLTPSQEKFVGFASQAHQLTQALKSFENTSIQIGVQNHATKISGAFTGEASLSSLMNYGSQFSLVGHSERRALFSETNATCLEKLKVALELKGLSIYCFGETLEEFENNKAEDTIGRQIEEVIGKLESKVTSEQIVLAYEPVWAIGTGRSASTEIIQERAKFISHKLKLLSLNQLPLLYGGSVKPENIVDILSTEGIDGVLVGGASLKADSFSKVCNALDSL